MSEILKVKDFNKGAILKQGDSTTLKYYLYDADEEQIESIIGKTAEVVFIKGGQVYYRTSGVISDLFICEFKIEEVLPTGVYHIEFLVGGHIFPSGDKPYFTLTTSSKGFNDQIITAHGFEEVVVLALEEVENRSAERLANLEVNYAGRLTGLESADQSITAQLAHIDSQVDLLNRGLGETFATLVALQTAYPTGDTKDHIVAADGHRYFWNDTSWADGGAYQAVEVLDGSIGVSKTDFISPNVLSVSRNVWNPSEHKIYDNGYNFANDFSVGTSYVVYAIPIESAWRGNAYKLNIDARQIIAVENLATSVTTDDYGQTAPTGETYFTSVSKGTSFIVPVNQTYKYLYFSFYLSGVTNTILSVGYVYMYAEQSSSIPEEYFEPVVEYTLRNDIVVGDIPAQYAPNPIYGKKLGVTGDSVCYGHMLGTNYAQIIATNNNMTLSNTAQNGYTIATGVNATAISDVVELIDVDSDYVLLEGGYNDFRQNVPLGALTSNHVYSGTLDTTTFYGALEKMLRYLFNNFKEAKKGYVISHKVSICDTPNTIGLTFGNYETAILNACGKYGVPVLNLYRTAGVTLLLDDNTIGMYTQVNQGQIHPNVLGYNLFYVPSITSFMKSL